MYLYLYLFIAIELFFVSLGDIKFKKIPNLWSLFNIVLFIFLVFFSENMIVFSLETFWYPLSFFGVGFLLFYLKLMGGGDSKFLATLFLLVPLNFQETFFICLLYATLIIGIIVLVHTTYKKLDLFKLIMMTRDFPRLKEVYNTKFTFAPVIFVSWLFFGYIIKIWGF